jgi:glycosyltransferase involved in cell wall biosynthesis
VTQSAGTILYLITEDWYFWSHRLPLAIAAKEAGYRVCLVTRVGDYGERIRQQGIELIPTVMRREGRNPARELRAIAQLSRIYRSVRPTIVHHVGVKPIVYGSIAGAVAKVPIIVNALPGLGFVFARSDRRARLFRLAIAPLFRRVMNRPNSSVILQNRDNQKVLVDAGIVSADKVALIRGSGVDLAQFPYQVEPDGRPVVVLASRMLWDKGVGEFVEAARQLKKRGSDARFVLVGDTDPANPASIRDTELRSWVAEGVVEWWGRRQDMPAVFAAASVVCLPSYCEGLPKVLLEAAASGRPIVTTDVPGCREIVRDGENGLLVPPRDAPAIATAVQKLLGDNALRERLGRRGREIVEAEFSVQQVVSETLRLYEGLVLKAASKDVAGGANNQRDGGLLPADAPSLRAEDLAVLD